MIALGRPAMACGGSPRAVGWRRQRGQSLVEMAIAMIVLVPLAAGIALLGQYIHIEQQTQAAARSAAWAATVDPALADEGLPSRAGVHKQLLARYFADSRAGIVSNPDAPVSFADPMLTAFSGSTLLRPDSLALTEYSQSVAPSYLDEILNGVGKLTKHLGNFPPNRYGLVTAEVHAQTETIKSEDGSPLDYLGVLANRRLDFSAKAVILADPWNAAGGGEAADGTPINTANSRTVRNVIRPLVPTALLGDGFDKVFNTVINVLGKIPIINKIFTPGFDNFQLGRISPDVIPKDKLVSYKNVR